ncbi:hypothetical protein, partial [Rhizobium sp. Pop5]|uniref:hypothetical protein n=1 Tax=Rhizobium sp. Pop5 TaxID=1223565 RepID=UPI001969E99A
MSRKALFPSGQENRTGGPSTLQHSSTCPLLGIPHREFQSATMTAAFQQRYQVALKQLLMQVSEKSITQMGY